MTRFLAVTAGSLVCAALLPAPAGAQTSLGGPPGCGAAGNPAKLAAWYAECEAQWAPLAREAGRPRGGAILGLRALASGDARGPQEALLSVKNVTSRATNLGCYDPEAVPYVLVRDAEGKAVRMTDEGLRYFSQDHIRLSTPAFVVQPGFAHGFVVPLGRLFQLREGAPYSVLAALGYTGDVDGRLVSNVLTLRPSSQPAAARAKEPAVTGRRPGAHLLDATGVAQENTWDRLLREAGRPRRGCVLEAVVSPADPSLLVASVTCLRTSPRARGGQQWEPGAGPWWWADDGDGRVDAGRQPADYRIMVLAPGGRFLPLTAYGKGVIASPAPERGSWVPRGDAVGAVIPLYKWFDMTEPGDYAVLVTLKAPDEKWRRQEREYLIAQGLPALPPEYEIGPMWVAEPITVKVAK